MPSFGRSRRRDQRASERQALEINDRIVQGLAEAQLAFELGRPEQAREAVDRTLAAARALVNELLGDVDTGAALRPGDLRRAAVADDAKPER